jgi:hypothetical protein
MKRPFLSALLLLTAIATQAQNRSAVMNRMLDNHSVSTRTTAPALNPRGGSAIWEEDFVNATNIPGGGVSANSGTWVTSGANGAVWKHGFTGTNGCWSTGIPQPTFATAGNGFLIFDADSANCTNPSSNPPGFSATALTGSITSPAIDLSGSNDVLLEFSHASRWCCQSSPLFIATSSNGGQTWSADIPVSAPEINVNQQATTVAFNLSAAIGGAADARIRFSWTAGTAYYWAVDDIRLVLPTENELILDYGYISHNGTGEEYGRVPVSQLYPEMRFGGSVINFGYADQTDLELSVSVRNAANVEVLSGLEPLALLASPDSAAMELNLDASALEAGLYTTTMEVVSVGDSADGANFSNNTINRRFEITEGLYSIDGIDVHVASQEQLSALGTNSFEDAEDGFMLLNYYDIRNTMNAAAVDIYLASGTIAGGSLIVSIHDTVNIYADDVFSPIAQAEIVDVTAAHISAGKVRVFFEEPIELEPNAYYVGVEMFGAGSGPDAPTTIRVLDDITIPQPGYSTMIYVPNDQVYGNGNAAAIRLLGDIYIGLEESNSSIGVTVYPNPNDGNTLQMSLTSTDGELVRYQLLNANGMEVLSSSFKPSIGTINRTLDISNLSAGIYLLRVASSSTNITRKVILTK